ncbi:hypothetical protein A2Z22_00890 [Candidatus Woesebacteria bacterium RBG_16_34_12]|uniref:Uncharacterized protein n=1 Tax=Candidatus Woesebacteria bacterium RBG_16_34_12 TaxID=1802480 RepID=A0A1F7X8U8_9BACT|nr:MAG: hypothetical protein A2Z22_00890 [Candidatus Woesebacteria bacterium RBG_16_34_12]
MREKETASEFHIGQSEYEVGQRVQFDTGHDDWIEGEVIDTSPRPKKGLTGILERVTRFHPMIVRIDKNAPTFAGAEVRVSRHGSRIRPKSVNSRTE